MEKRCIVCRTELNKDDIRVVRLSSISPDKPWCGDCIKKEDARHLKETERGPEITVMGVKTRKFMSLPRYFNM